MSIVTWDRPMSSHLQARFSRRLRQTYPILEREILGRTAAGRPVEVLRLGTGKRQVLLTAAHHANESITALLLWRLLEDYCKGVREGGCLFGFSCRWLFERSTLHVIPLVNPDGADLTAGKIPPDAPEYQNVRTLADTQPHVPFPCGWKANLAGVDLNLNYPARWEVAKEKKVQEPGPRDYPGDAPLDQPETMALAAYTRQICPDALGAWHTQGGEIYAAHPDGRVPDEALAKLLGSASGYALCQVPLESANAGFRDWFLQEFDRPGFTIEAGRGENPLPLTDLPQLYRENLPIFVLLLAGL